MPVGHGQAMERGGDAEIVDEMRWIRHKQQSCQEVQLKHLFTPGTKETNCTPVIGGSRVSQHINWRSDEAFVIWASNCYTGLHAVVCWGRSKDKVDG